MQHGSYDDCVDSTGSWSTPPGCVGNACTYRAEWSLDAGTDVITFTIAAKQGQGRWTGIAFAPQPRMVRVDLGQQYSRLLRHL